MRLAPRPGTRFRAVAALVDNDPTDIVALLELLALTDPASRDVATSLAAFPPDVRYRGPGSAAVMLPFLRPTPSRFSAGRFGVLYGANAIETAIAEVSYHHARRLMATSAPNGTMIILTLWAFRVGTEVVDLRGYDAAIYDSDNYSGAQKLGSELRAANVSGVLFSSVRRAGGECLGIFVPRVVESMEKRDDWRLIWDGATISEVLRVA